MQHQAATRTRCQKSKVIVICRWRDADPAGDLRPSHQQLHADECSKRVPGDPQPTTTWVDGLHPVKSACGVTDLTNTAIVTTLATTNPSKVESHHRKAQALECLVHSVSDPVVHGPAMHRVWMQHQRQRRTLLLTMVVTTFEPTVRAGEHHLRHGIPFFLAGLAQPGVTLHPIDAGPSPQQPQPITRAGITALP